MIHLRLRTEYNFKRAYGPIPKIMIRLKQLGSAAAGIADRGTWGHVQFYNECKANNIKPILGAEIEVVADAKLRERQPTNYMAFLAKSNAGLKELYELVTHSTDPSNFYYSPRIDYRDVAGVSNDLFVLSGTLPNLDLLQPKSNLFVENSFNTSKKLSDWAIANNIPFVKTCDNYYTFAADKIIYEILREGDGESFTYPMHIPDRGEMATNTAHEFESDKNSIIIAEECNVTLPQAQLVRYKKEKSLQQLCIEAAKGRDVDLSKPEYNDRLQRELKLIADKDYEDYFYVLWDLIGYAKKNMLVGPARGSSCGSLVCYILGITEIDPLPYGLLFERFIDITRKDLPDVDVDFADDRREMVFDYLYDKYGNDCVARLGTISRFKAKSAIAATAKATIVPEFEVAELKNRIIERSTGDSRARFCIADTFKELDIGKAVIEKYPQMIFASDLEYHASHSGQHAAGIVVTQDPVTDYCSLDKRTGALQVDKYDAEKLNLLKIDALGLRTLSILQDILDQIARTRDWLYKLPTTDLDAYAVLNNKRYAGIFQFEGFALQSFCSQMKVESFEDFASITSLARPGPLNSGSATDFVERRTGRKKPEYLPLCEEYTKNTYGVVIAQEQVMQIVRNVGKLSWEDTSNLRKAMSKSLGKEFFDTYWERFKKGANENGLNDADALLIWEHVNTHGSWSFNRCLSGDTKIILAATGKDGEKIKTIRQLYKEQKIRAIFSLQPDGMVRTKKFSRMYYNGRKICNKYVFEDGSFVVCTQEHKFVIDGEWKQISEAKKGSLFLAVGSYRRPKWLRDETDEEWMKRRKFNQEGFPTGKKHPNYKSGRIYYFEIFREKYKKQPCEDCGKKKRRMEVHHNDFSKGMIDPKDLSWLCPSCHKRRHDDRGRNNKNTVGRPTKEIRLVKVKRYGSIDTYDLDVPETHNFALANGLITHNSHAVAYGLVSYWCCYLKAHHPLEFAVANLRNARDNDQAIRLLREFSREGIAYVPVDVEKSSINWTVQDGVLIGGLTGIKGCGKMKAEAIIKKRKAKLPFLPGELKLLNSPVTPWDDVFECRTRWGHMKKNPEKYNIKTPIMDISDVTGTTEGEFLIFGKLKEKNLRDLNETVNLAKRGGQKVESNNVWLNIMVEDDTGSIICRIDRWKYPLIGKPIIEGMQEDEDWLLIKGRVSRGFRLIVVDKYRHLTRGENENTTVKKDDSSERAALEAANA